MTLLIDLILDCYVELQFFWYGTYPTALIDQIAARKGAIYESLGPDLARQGWLSGSAEFKVEGRHFTVLFESDRRRDDPSTDTRSLWVLHIDEHS